MIRSLLVLAIAGAVASTPTFVSDKPSAPPHAMVVAKTKRPGALRSVRKRVLRLYLEDVPLGRVAVGKNGNGRLRFEVPNLPEGRYPLRLRGLPGRPAMRTVGSFAVAAPLTPLRTCGQSVYGELSEEYVARSLRVGPLRFVGYNAAAASSPSWLEGSRTRSGQYARKILLLVERGAEATISISVPDRRAIALAYMPERFNARRVTDADAAVGFRACSEGESDRPYTQFNGSFVFRHPLCAHVEVTPAGRPEPIRLALPFGMVCGFS